MKSIISLVSFVLILSSGCYSKRLILQADAVSMTRLNADGTKQLKVAEAVDEKWCIRTDEPVLKAQAAEGQVGLADQVIYKAQGGGKDADFITDARIWVDSEGCAMISGKRAKL